MNGSQVHLAFSHFPIAGMFFSLILFVLATIFKIEKFKLAGIGIVLISAITGVVMMESGERAEKIVEHKPLVTKEIIHEHEEAAETANIVIIITAAIGAIYLVFTKLNPGVADKIFLILVLSNLVAAGLVANAAHLGGKVRHDEIRTP